jgi:DNA polymerase
MNYRSFEEAKIKCRDCLIGKCYNVVVPSDGCKTNPIVLIIGEAPGSDEISLLRPFVGKSGKLLRYTLNQFGYRKSNSLISNTIPCRPENNKFPHDSELVEDCVKKWLKEEIELTNPHYILLIGATPLRYLIGLSGITKLRGQWLEYDPMNKKIPCMPTYHPSYVQRKEHMEDGKRIKEEFISDIKMVAEKAGFIK